MLFSGKLFSVSGTLAGTSCLGPLNRPNLIPKDRDNLFLLLINRSMDWARLFSSLPYLVAHGCGYPLSRYTCRATRVAADFLDFIAFCRCSSGVAPHPLKIMVSRPPPPFPGGVAPKFGSEKVSRYTGVSQVQLRVSRYTVQLSFLICGHKKHGQ